jgi:hypothetical protein
MIYSDSEFLSITLKSEGFSISELRLSPKFGKIRSRTLTIGDFLSLLVEVICAVIADLPYRRCATFHKEKLRWAIALSGHWERARPIVIVEKACGQIFSQILCSSKLPIP